MNREEFEELFDITESDLRNVVGDSTMLGLEILKKYVDEKTTIITGVAHDCLYSLEVDKVVEAGITEEDTKELARLNWCIDEDHDCFLSFV